jgi:hypothetical protein
MTPLFTIHAGEYLVGSYIERHYGKQLSVWIPSKDTGIDLLVTDRQNQHTASVQVKFAKDFLPTMDADFQEPLRVCTWFTINRNKLHDSRANFWVFVLSGFKKHSRDFVVVPTAELQDRLMKIHGNVGKKVIQSYLWVTEDNRCWETRDLSKGDWRRIARNEYDDNPDRDFTKHLNEAGWRALLIKLGR